MSLFNIVKKNLLDFAKKSVNELAQEKSRNSAPQVSVPAGAPAVDCYSFRGTVEEYFYQILVNRFPQYSVQTNVSFPNAGPKALPVTYLIHANNQPILAVIIAGKHKHGLKCLHNTEQACLAQGIQVQCYYREFRNRADYVIQRLGQVLR